MKKQKHLKRFEQKNTKHNEKPQQHLKSKTNNKQNLRKHEKHNKKKKTSRTV